MFWFGLIIGFFIGVFWGVLSLALVQTASSDSQVQEVSKGNLMEYDVEVPDDDDFDITDVEDWE